MNSVNKSFQNQFRDYKEIDISNVIIDDRFVDETDEVKKSKRPWVLFFLMLLAIAFFLFDQYYRPSLSEEPVIVEEPKVVSIDSVLMNNHVFSEVNTGSNAIPEAVLDFINGHEFIKEKASPKQEKIVIYEIVEQVDNSEKIQSLLAEGKNLFRADRLTSPKGNNAFERYEWVLALDADNQAAKAGIQRIVDRYITLAERVIKKNEAYKVPGLINNAYKVGHKYMDMTPTVEKYKRYIKDPSAFIQIPLVSKLTNQELDKSIADLSKEPSVKEEKKDLPPQPLLDVDEGIALTAKKLITQGDIDGAIAVLTRFTVVSDYWGKSYELLFNLYLDRDDIVSAKKLVVTNTSLDTFQMAEKAARMFFASDDSEGGIVLLRGHTPKIDQYREYYAVKASLYHDTGQYAEAINIYRQLIALDYDNSRYWLGMAVSLDALGDDSAEDAFRYAAQYSETNPKVKEYIDQRLLVLSPE